MIAALAWWELAPLVLADWTAVGAAVGPPLGRMLRRHREWWT